MTVLFHVEVEADSGAALIEDMPNELARMLRVVADKVQDGQTFGHLLDVNGNGVGTFWFEED